MKPLNDTLFKGATLDLPTRSAVTAHKSKCCQEWFANNVLALIQVEDCTPGSSDLNPLDCELCEVLEQNAYRKRRPNLEALKRSIIEEAEKIPLMICKSIAK